MRDDNDSPFGTIIFALLCLAFLAWMYRSNYRDCMKLKNDPVLCDIYARPR